MDTKIKKKNEKSVDSDRVDGGGRWQKEMKGGEKEREREESARLFLARNTREVSFLVGNPSMKGEIWHTAGRETAETETEDETLVESSEVHV